MVEWKKSGGVGHVEEKQEDCDEVMLVEGDYRRGKKRRAVEEGGVR